MYRLLVPNSLPLPGHLQCVPDLEEQRRRRVLYHDELPQVPEKECEVKLLQTQTLVKDPFEGVSQKFPPPLFVVDRQGPVVGRSLPGPSTGVHRDPSLPSCRRGRPSQIYGSFRLPPPRRTPPPRRPDPTPVPNPFSGIQRKELGPTLPDTSRDCTFTGQFVYDDSHALGSGSVFGLLRRLHFPLL